MADRMVSGYDSSVTTGTGLLVTGEPKSNVYGVASPDKMGILKERVFLLAASSRDPQPKNERLASPR